MKRTKTCGAVAAILLCCLCSTRLFAEPVAPAPEHPTTQPSTGSPFLRFVEDNAGGGKLQTAIVTFQNKAGVTVHLVAALHVGEKSYYQGLNKTFTGYDALLYEMVKPKGSRPPAPGAKSRSGVGMFQHFLKDALDLDFQLDDVDYTAANFVHADLDAETFEDLQQARGESIMGIMLQSMLREMQRDAEGHGQQQEMGLLDLLIAMRAPDRPRQLKLLLARQFENIEDQMAGMDGPNGSVLITERNKKCIETLKQSIADGDKNIGIFFGAGHMRDLSQRLEAMGFHKTASEWRVGWDMTAPPSTRPATAPAQSEKPAE